MGLREVLALALSAVRDGARRARGGDLREDAMLALDTNAVQLAMEIELPPGVFVPGKPDGVVGLYDTDVGVAPAA
jgi:hypothetical protein